MEELKAAISAAFAEAEQVSDPRMSKVKLALQQAAANAGLTDLAFELRGKIASGASPRADGFRKANRFNTVPPNQSVFVDPNLSAARKNAERAASDKDDIEAEEAEANADAASNSDAAASVYDKIANMSPSAIVNQYGESAIEGMITAKGGDLKEVDGKKPNQKAAYLKSLCAPE
jgi:hypothetical protein